ncbi:hypothetical protein RJT34_05588 [Clitoria ternatea]|uniref:Wings apart-like protein C-terminal domain-containing protein n=1 Tax=Clitoria ternatea TaxID=43366 RepID=A0AAN9PT72_CLITE
MEASFNHADSFFLKQILPELKNDELFNDVFDNIVAVASEHHFEAQSNSEASSVQKPEELKPASSLTSACLTYLLGLKRKLSSQATSFSFVKLVITLINFLSDVSSSQNASATSNDNKQQDMLLTDDKEKETIFINSNTMYRYLEKAPPVKSFNHFKKCQLLTSTKSKKSQNMIFSSSTCNSYSGASRGPDSFAFYEDDIEPSKWDLLSGKRKRSPSNYKATNRELNNVNVNCSNSYIGDEASSCLLSDCLLTAVKVLINLTNDNPVGCQQIAANGGLEIMPFLIVGHFPSFSSSSPSFARIIENRHLTDHELDFLVAILGLLVNLIEKDAHNRSRLAAVNVIQLLCTLFLANQGEGEEAQYLLLEDGEKEAGKMILEAYSALLLAFLSTESKSVREAIAGNLPHQNLSILVPVLNRFVEFHSTLNMISPETHKTVCEVLVYFTNSQQYDAFLAYFV